FAVLAPQLHVATSDAGSDPKKVPRRAYIGTVNCGDEGAAIGAELPGPSRVEWLPRPRPGTATGAGQLRISATGSHHAAVLRADAAAPRHRRRRFDERAVLRPLPAPGRLDGRHLRTLVRGLDRARRRHHDSSRNARGPRRPRPRHG